MTDEAIHHHPLHNSPTQMKMEPRDAQGVCVKGLHHILESLHRASSRLLELYSDSGHSLLSEHLRVFRDLRQVDRLLVVYASNGGAVGDDSVIPAGGALMLARAGLQASLLRRMFDAGKGFNEGIDPHDSDDVEISIQQTLPRDSLQAAQRDLRMLCADLQALIARSSPDTAPPVTAFDVLANTARNVLRELASWHESFEDLVVDLWKLDTAATAVCNSIMARFECDLCSLQLIRRDDVIETIAGEGESRPLVGLSKHSIEQNEMLRDIQADIVLRQRAEVIKGEDTRFDHYIYTKYDHSRLVRAFVPLVIFRDALGKVVTPQQEWDCWAVDPNPEGRHGELVLALRAPDGLEPDVIGTIEAGFKCSSARSTFEPNAAILLAQVVMKNAPNIHRLSVEHTLERVVELLREKAGANSAALHLVDQGSKGAQRRNFFLARAGNHGRMVRAKDAGKAGAVGAAPRIGGMGDEALQSVRYTKLAGEALRRRTPNIWAEGVRSVVAFPLLWGTHRALVYMHYSGQNEPDDDVLDSISLLTARYGRVLGDAFEHVDARDRSQQLAACQRALTSLLDRRAHPTRRQLGYAIAWNTRNLLAADVVTVHEYDEKQHRFSSNSPYAGQLKEPEAIGGRVLQNDVRWELIRLNRALFPSEDGSDFLLQKNFSKREDIKSVGAIPLRAGAAVVGLLFISFRHRRLISATEKRFLDDLAAAYGALMNQYRRTPRRRSEHAVELVAKTVQNVTEDPPPPELPNADPVELVSADQLTQVHQHQHGRTRLS